MLREEVLMGTGGGILYDFQNFSLLRECLLRLGHKQIIHQP